MLSNRAPTRETGTRATMSEAAEDTTTRWEDLAELGRYHGLANAQEHALVVLAMRQPCWVQAAEDGAFLLHTEPAAAEAARREISAYDHEQADSCRDPSPSGGRFRFKAGGGALALWMLALIAGFLLQQHDPSLTDRGASSSVGLIGHGDWWRPLTSLFLHADLPHLVGNLIAGACFGTLASKSIGAARAWPLILLGGVGGNTLTSLTAWPEAYESIGASTAVFGALGLLSGIGFVSLWRSDRRLPWLKITAPVLAGVVLLGWLGGAPVGAGVDVAGHAAGFLCGLVGGSFAEAWPRKPSAATAQDSPRTGIA